MKFLVDGNEVLNLTETQKKVLQHDLPTESFHDDICRRVNYIVTHKYEQCFKRLKDEWEPKLVAAGVESIPTNPDKLAELIFSQPDYKSRSQRDAE